MEIYVGLEETLVIQTTQIERLIVAHNVYMQMITKLPYNIPNPGTQHQGRVFGVPNKDKVEYKLWIVE